MVSALFYRVAGKVSEEEAFEWSRLYRYPRKAVGSGYAKILHVSKLAVLEGEQESHVTTDREVGNRRR